MGVNIPAQLHSVCKISFFKSATIYKVSATTKWTEYVFPWQHNCFNWQATCWIVADALTLPYSFYGSTTHMFTNTSLILEHRRHHFTRQQLGGSILIPKYTALNEVAQVRPLKHSQNTNNRTILSKLSLMSSQHEILAHFTSVMTPIHELIRISTRKKMQVWYYPYLWLMVCI